MLCFLKIIQRHSAKYVKRHRSDHFSRCCEMPHYVSGMQTDSKEFVAKENYVTFVSSGLIFMTSGLWIRCQMCELFVSTLSLIFAHKWIAAL